MINRIWTRRALIASAGLAPFASTFAWAETTPFDKPIKVIVPFGPGGLADVTIRIVAERVAAEVNQQVTIINQPGAGGVSAAKAVLAAPADGSTLALFTNGTAVSVALVANLPFDPATDFVPAAMLGQFDFLFLTAKASGYATLGDFIAAAKAKPGTLNIGTINVGSTQNLSAVLFRRVAGIDVAIVPFRTTSDVVTALLRGDVQLGVEAFGTTKSMLEEGALRALATSGPVASAYMPAVPPARASELPAFDVTSWNALFAPKGTPAPFIAALNARVNAALGDATVVRRLLDLGIVAAPLAPSALGARLAADITKWTDVATRAGITKQ